MRWSLAHVSTLLAVFLLGFIQSTQCLALLHHANGQRLADQVRDITRIQHAHRISSRRLQQNPDKPALTKDGGLTMQELLAEGYPLEQYKVETHDGWILNVYRIPHGKYRNNKPGPRPVVMLHHGITLSSACFTLLNSNESIAYILADAGFDVWMANTRSNTFSRGNLYYSFRDPEYWYHTYDQYALIDGPAQIEKALEVSGAKKLAFIGHSQGCTVAAAMLAGMPEMNEKISVVIHMGPVIFIDWFRAPFLKAMGDARNDQFFNNAKLGEFLWYRFLAPYVQTCRENVWSEMCVSTLNAMFYGPSAFIAPDDFVVIGQTWPATVSARNVQHWAQQLTDKKLQFQMFDHGTNCKNRTWFAETCNQLAYGSLVPPEYDLGKVTAPQVILEGEIDLMSTTEDVQEQWRRYPRSTIVSDTVYSQYSHMDFVWDRNARHAYEMVDIMFRYSPSTF